MRFTITSLNGQGLEIISAYSARARGARLLREHPDAAVVLLDVVMESDVAGLELVDYIRNELKNETVRIILRTGQPGQAPERRVIIDYDINDYKAKTELTADKLFTTLTAALRSYQQLQRLVETRRGLEIIIDAASTLFDFRSMQRLAEGVLTQIASLLNVDCAGILVLREGGNGDRTLLRPGRVRLLQAVHRRARRWRPNCAGWSTRPSRAAGTNSTPRRSVLYIRTASGREVVVLIEAARHLSDTDRSLVEVFCSKLSVAFDNVILYEELQEANTRLEERVAARTRELTLANERLGAQWERLRRANAFKREIIGTVAHDLKNPLGVIMGRAEMLTDVVGVQADQRRHGGRADRAHSGKRPPPDRHGRYAARRRHGRRARHQSRAASRSISSGLVSGSSKPAGNPPKSKQQKLIVVGADAVNRHGRS